MEYGLPAHWHGKYLIAQGDLGKPLGLVLLPDRQVLVGNQPQLMPREVWRLRSVVVELDDSSGNIREGYRISFSACGISHDIPHRLHTSHQMAGFRCHWQGDLVIDGGIRIYLQSGFLLGDVVHWAILYQPVLGQVSYGGSRRQPTNVGGGDGG